MGQFCHSHCCHSDRLYLRGRFICPASGTQNGTHPCRLVAAWRFISGPSLVWLACAHCRPPYTHWFWHLAVSIFWLSVRTRILTSTVSNDYFTCQHLDSVRRYCGQCGLPLALRSEE